MKFIHTSDWQIGMARHFLDADAQARFNDSRLEAIRAIGRIAKEESCEFVVVAGDVFDKNGLRPRTVYGALEAIGECDVTFYLLPGNHDRLDPSSIYRSSQFESRKPANVVILDEPGFVDVSPGVQILAAPLLTHRPLTDLLAEAIATAEIKGGDQSGVRIGVAHGQLDSLVPNQADPALISLTAAEQNVRDGSLDYIALGDRHSTLDVGQTGRIWYSGSPEPTDYVQDDDGNFLIVDLDKADPVEKRHIASWSFIRKEFPLNGADDLKVVDDWLESLSQKDRKILKLAFRGTVSIREQAELTEILDRARDLFAAVEHWERESDLAIRPGDDDFIDLGLSGFAKEALNRLITEAVGANAVAGGPSDDVARVAQEALGLLYRLARSGS